MREDAADQYLSYKLIESNQDWKAKWFYISNHHPRVAEAERVSAETQAMVEHRAHHVGVYSATRVAEEDQGPVRGRTEGITHGHRLHEEEGAAVDGARHPRVPIHRR
jgi:hypothetical protein